MNELSKALHRVADELLKKAENRVAYCNACETADEAYKVRRNEADMFYDMVSAVRLVAKEHEGDPK